MARSEVSTSFQRVIVRHAYRWPETTLWCWAIFMIISGLYLITNFAKMANQQSKLGLGTPWYVREHPDYVIFGSRLAADSVKS
jgi:hypothetical protein